MNLVKFMVYGIILSLGLGQLGHFPFGSSFGINISDILIGITIILSLIWIVETKQKVLLPLKLKWLGLFLIISLISLIFSLTLFPLLEVLKGSLYLLRFVAYSSLILITYNLVKHSVLKLDSLIIFLIISGVFLIILGFIQLITLPNLDSSNIVLTEYGFDPHQGRLTSTFLDPNYLGTYLVLTLILITSKIIMSNKWIPFGVLTLSAVFLTYSRSAYIMLIVSFLTAAYLLFRTNLVKLRYLAFLGIILITISLLLVMIFPKVYQRAKGGLELDVTSKHRIESWKKGFLIFKSSPLLGVGFNNLRAAQTKLNLQDNLSFDGGHSGAGVDSGLLFILSATGLIGFFIFMLFWKEVFTSAVSKEIKISPFLVAAFLGLLINGQFINSLFYPPIMVWVYSLTGAILAKAEK